MEQLRIEFDGGNIRRSGADIIGLFTLTGTIEEGNVAIGIQYLGQQSVDYLGSYDGEGTMHGMWRISSFGGKRMIKLIGHTVETGRLKYRNGGRWWKQKATDVFVNVLNAIQPLVHGLLHLDHRVSRSSPCRAHPLRTAAWTAVTPFA